MDSPGMRELQIADVEAGVSVLFDDIDQLAQMCRFNDCTHADEPGCAVQKAIGAGILETRRLESYCKLQREQLINSETISERHARTRQFGKMTRAAVDEAHKKRS